MELRLTGTWSKAKPVITPAVLRMLRDDLEAMRRARTSGPAACLQAAAGEQRWWDCADALLDLAEKGLEDK